jgi:hypothetical protein
LGLGIECLAEFHDVQAALTQRWADRGGRVGFTSWHLQLDETNDFLCHCFLLTGDNAWVTTDSRLRLPGVDNSFLKAGTELKSTASVWALASP